VALVGLNCRALPADHGLEVGTLVVVHNFLQSSLDLIPGFLDERPLEISDELHTNQVVIPLGSSDRARFAFHRMRGFDHLNWLFDWGLTQRR